MSTYDVFYHTTKYRRKRLVLFMMQKMPADVSRQLEGSDLILNPVGDGISFHQVRMQQYRLTPTRITGLASEKKVDAFFSHFV